MYVRSTPKPSSANAVRTRKTLALVLSMHDEHTPSSWLPAGKGESHLLHVPSAGEPPCLAEPIPEDATTAVPHRSLPGKVGEAGFERTGTLRNGITEGGRGGGLFFALLFFTSAFRPTYSQALIAWGRKGQGTQAKLGLKST
ncbi:hypothetical protein CGRA01v4_10436 [Colletotrichum graminicola]|nr:hypothetical protein CGRA01v4_10436 [Colletotrichum graminicola]